jgi:DNA-binding ferritin-like protein
VAQDANEIRQAIEQARDDIAETVQAIGEKADVKARAGDKLAESRDALKGSAAEATAKLGDVVQ